MIVEVVHSACGPIKLVNTPIKYSHAQPGIRRPPPTLGQHTNEILRDLHFNDKEIAFLRDGGVIS
jgi:succinate--hydroxymethylglutarate CoA-transferase